MCLVRIEDVSLFIPGDPARRSVLRDINLEICRGRHYALTGANGSGKSSLLRLIHGDLWPASGRIFWQPGSRPETSPIVGRKLSRLVSPAIQAEIQARGWSASVRSLLAGAREDSPYAFAGNGSGACEAEIAALLRDLDGLKLLDLPLSELSQGQLRLALLARAILARPRLLLLDEWSDGLDARRRDRVLRSLAALASGTAMVFVAHSDEALPDWVDGRLHMEDGRLSHEPPPPCVPAPRRGPVHARKEAGPTLFELRNVSVVVAGKPLLQNINWRLRTGENWRISGPNGAGKSTFLRLLAGDEFVYAGGELAAWSGRTGEPLLCLASKRAAISLVSDLGSARYDYDITALELILSGHENSVGLYREYSPAEIAWADCLLASFFDSPALIRDRSIRMLSAGQLRRLFLARSLASRPEVILLDEPCSGLDPQSRGRFLTLLDDLAAGKIAGLAPALVFVSHEPEAPQCINRWAEMRAGDLAELPAGAFAPGFRSSQGGS